MGQRRNVIAIVVGMLSVVAVALWVIFQAAYHPIREGSRVLGPEGERLTLGARRLAGKAPAAEPQPEPGPEPEPEPVAEPQSESALPQPTPPGQPLQQPPRQQGSPLATPASGVSGTISR